MERARMGEAENGHHLLDYYFFIFKPKIFPINTYYINSKKYKYKNNRLNKNVIKNSNHNVRFAPPL